jgi:hypothetical protein
MEAEKVKAAEEGAGNNAVVSAPQDAYVPRVIDPSEYAVSGVYFSCPLIGIKILHIIDCVQVCLVVKMMMENWSLLAICSIGPEVLTKDEIEGNIKDFLLEQPEEELGVTSCLLIHSCNKPLEKVKAIQYMTFYAVKNQNMAELSSKNVYVRKP